jgi:hypothetical protein
MHRCFTHFRQRYRDWPVGHRGTPDRDSCSSLCIGSAVAIISVPSVMFIFLLYSAKDNSGPRRAGRCFPFTKKRRRPRPIFQKRRRHGLACPNQSLCTRLA